MVPIFGSHEKPGQVLKGLSMHICKLNDFVIMARYMANISREQDILN
jgi:hypothetical protein